MLLLLFLVDVRGGLQEALRLNRGRTGLHPDDLLLLLHGISAVTNTHAVCRPAIYSRVVRRQLLEVIPQLLTARLISVVVDAQEVSVLLAARAATA